MPGAGASDRLTLGLLLGLGLAARLAAVCPPAIDGDEAWSGIASLKLLEGVFPYFFYGQPYHGGLGMILLAPVVAALGPSRITLKLFTVLLSLLFVYLTWALARRLFDRDTACLATLVAALPSRGLLQWSVSGHLHYSLAPVLGVLLFLVAERLFQPPGGRAWLRFGLLGVLSGLAVWTNYIALIFVGAAGCGLLLARPGPTLGSGVRYAVPGFLLGSLPLWLYNLQIGRLFVTPRGSWAEPGQFPANSANFFTVALPGLLGVPDPAESRVAWGAGMLLIGCLALSGAGWLAWRARRDARLAMVPLAACGMAILATASVYGENIPARYVFPVFGVVPLIVGAGLGLIATRARLLGWGLAVLLALLHGTDLLAHASSPDAWARYRAEGVAEQALLGRLRSLGVDAAYSEDYGALNYVSGGTLVFSRTRKFEDPYPPFAHRVDATADGVYVSPIRSARLEAGLKALSAQYEVTRADTWRIYHRFRLDPVAYEELRPDGWTASATHAGRTASHAIDRDGATLWKAPQQPGTAFTLDLGRTERIGMLAWVPVSYRHGSIGFEVSVSEDGGAWRTVADLPEYGFPVYVSGPHPFYRLRRARVEVRFPETPARFVRITQLRSNFFDWAIRELFVYRPVAWQNPPDYLGVDRIARELMARRVSRVYGDHWTLARLREVSSGRLPVLSTTIYVDRNGRTDLYRGWEHPPDLSHLDPLRLEPTTAVVLEAWTGTGPAFEALLGEMGYRFRREALGDHLVYTAFVAPALPDRPLPRDGWRATASHGEASAGLALDGQRGTRWSTVGVRTQEAGMWFRVDLGRLTTLGTVELDLDGSWQDYPRGITLATSTDGLTWEPATTTALAVGPLAWLGTHGVRRGVERLFLRFPPRTARHLRLELTRGDQFYAWSIHEVLAHGGP